MTLTDHPRGDDPGSGRRPGPRIAAVIPALDEALSIARVVEGLRGQRLLASGEIIVVDNGSADGTGEIARAAGARVVRGGEAEVRRIQEMLRYTLSDPEDVPKAGNACTTVIKAAEGLPA